MTPFEADQLKILREIMAHKNKRQALVSRYIDLVFNSDEIAFSPEADEVLNELAYDLNFYVANPDWRAEDPSYFGDERLEQEIRDAFAKLRVLGIEMPPERPAVKSSC